jgi:hypothetical protein
MNNMDSKARKMAYLVAILVLLVPIYILGAPASSQGDDRGGGKLAQLRDEYDLGESDIGQVDPTSTAMNFLLLGLRGIAVNKLRLELEEYKNNKEWAQMEATTKAVVKLQPHYVEVWRYLSWNLTYNVSAEWDAVPDRYYWVKKGGKFAQQATEKNRDVPELFWEVGKTWGNKIGRSDEWKYFRKYFKSDPDAEAWKGGPDNDINPKGLDNYLVAREWYTIGNDRETHRPQHIMMHSIFRSYPARSLLDQADTLQREGQFTGKTERAWDAAYEAWVKVYGVEHFDTGECIVFMEADEDELRELNKDVKRARLKRYLNLYQNTVNYRYWRTRSQSERLKSTAEAHELFHLGEQEFIAGRTEDAVPYLLAGMEKYRQLLVDFPDLRDEDLTKEEGMWSIMMWRRAMQANGEDIPSKFPLRKLWDDNQSLKPQMERKFDTLGR